MKRRNVWLPYAMTSMMLAALVTFAYFGDAVQHRVAIDGVASRSPLWYAAGVLFVMFWMLSWLPFAWGPWLFGYRAHRRLSRRDQSHGSGTSQSPTAQPG